MFDLLAEKFQNLFSNLARGKFTDSNLSQALKEAKKALLEADVNYTVAISFVERVKRKTLGEVLLKSLTPKQQFIKIVHSELVALMGGEEAFLDLKKKPSVIVLCGLQGSGKTTQCAKLGFLLQKRGKRVLLAACDLQRPAAIEQLEKLGKLADLSVFSRGEEKDPSKVAKEALKKAQREGFDVVIIDTMGRIHLDTKLMEELGDLCRSMQPEEILFVANAATGQEAVNITAKFNEHIAITGSILTMLDGDARGGAAISICEVTKKPLKFEGIGEKIGDLRPFNPTSMADRILGRGDIINLVRKVEEGIDAKESQKMERKLKKATFNFEDYLKQMQMVKRMGSLGSLAKMFPGFSGLGDLSMSDKKIKSIEAIILSMTKEEREEKNELTFNRKKRIAIGSGTSMADVDRVIQGFKKLKKVFRKLMSKHKGMFPDMMQQMGGKLWR